MKLELEIAGRDGTTVPLAFEVKRMVNGGLSNRDQAGAQEHLDELRREGINIQVETTPVLFPKMVSRIQFGGEVEVLADSRTCGEVEPVLLVGKDEMFLAVGSDHSDRELEKHDLVISKQMCPNVISDTVWRYTEIADHWDQIVMRSFTIDEQGKRELHQEGKLGDFMEVDNFLEKVREHIADGNLDGMVLYMGTPATLGGKLVFTPGFAVELVDDALGRRLECSYTLTPMTWFK